MEIISEILMGLMIFFLIMVLGMNYICFTDVVYSKKFAVANKLAHYSTTSGEFILDLKENIK